MQRHIHGIYNLHTDKSLDLLTLPPAIQSEPSSPVQPQTEPSSPVQQTEPSSPVQQTEPASPGTKPVYVPSAKLQAIMKTAKQALYSSDDEVFEFKPPKKKRKKQQKPAIPMSPITPTRPNIQSHATSTPIKTRSRQLRFNRHMQLEDIPKHTLSASIYSSKNNPPEMPKPPAEPTEDMVFVPTYANEMVLLQDLSPLIPKCFQVPADGNCLWHKANHMIQTWKEIKQETIQHYQTCNRHTGQITDTAAQERIRQLQDGDWGKEFDIEAYCHHRGLVAFVHNRDADHWQVYTITKLITPYL